MESNIIRCSKCVTPLSYPGASIDKEGVCYYCREYEKIWGNWNDSKELRRRSFERLLDKAREKKNVWLLGQKPYEQIPQYGKFFDVAIIPWRKSNWTTAANPIKLKEYLALGKPIVSTAIPEINKYKDVVYEARTAEEFALMIKKAISEDCPERTIERRKKVQNDTWDSKAKLVLEKLLADIGTLQRGQLTL